MDDFLKLLSEYIALKSISTDPQFKPEIIKTVTWLSTIFTKNNFTVETLQGPTCNPIVFATLVVDPKLPTVLIYGHYDVQPASLTDGWSSDPFTLTQTGDRLVGRGVIDNKGQNLIHIHTVCQLAKRGLLTYNVKFLLEGNEETANHDMRDLLLKHKDKLQADYVLVSDGEIMGDNPTIEVSLRGGFNLTLTYTTANTNVHSGIYGGAIPNAAQELVNFLSHLDVPNFRSAVDPISADQRQNNLSLEPRAQELLSHIGVKRQLTEPDTDFFTQTGLLPTIQITGLKSGYIDTGYANIVPAKAEVRLNFRLVKSQTAEDIVKLFKDYVAKATPDYVNYDIAVDGLHNPVKLDTTNPAFIKVRQMLELCYQKPVLTKNVGGAIPFVTDVKDIFGLDTLLISLGNDDCNMHGTNENFREDLIAKGLAFSKMFFTTAI